MGPVITSTVIPGERRDPRREVKGTQVFDTVTVATTWVVRTLSLRTPSCSLTRALAGNDTGGVARAERHLAGDDNEGSCTHASPLTGW
jgi:hypothetical protein